MLMKSRDILVLHLMGVGPFFYILGGGTGEGFGRYGAPKTYMGARTARTSLNSRRGASREVVVRVGVG